jgi:hypothetical protein
MVAPSRKHDALADEARRIYEDSIRRNVEPGQNGKFIVINLDTGEYEVDEDDLTASDRAIARFGKARLVTLRIGQPAAYRLGKSTGAA